MHEGVWYVEPPSLGGPSTLAAAARMGRPALVTTLKLSSTSAVYRLVGLGLVAKRAAAATALVERAVYQDILPAVDVWPLALRAYWPAAVGGDCWLVLDDAGDLPYEPADCRQRGLAARWLARLHGAASVGRRGVDLPDAGPARYLGHLQAARSRMQESLAAGFLEPDDRRVLEAFLRDCEVVRSRWPEVERACAAAPATLVHGDLVPKNMRVRCRRGEPGLAVFDWEVAGWGVPAADLAECEDLATYVRAIQPWWPCVPAEHLRQLAELGKLFRLLAATDWAACGLRDGWVRRPMRHLREYRVALAGAVARNGWPP